MPVRDVETLKTLNSDVLGIFATEEWISKDIIEDFAGKMSEAGKKLTYIIFQGAHGFANPSNPKYEPEATAKAFQMTFDYLTERFNKN
jgi:carboxymethylenebutenolidase